MPFINVDVRSKIFVVLIILGTIGVAILLGVTIFELPWNPGRLDMDGGALNSSALTLTRLENDWNASYELGRAQNSTDNYLDKVETLLRMYPVIDGHNDLPWNLRNLIQNDLRKFNFSADLTKVEPWRSYNESYTDIPRLRKGRVGAQFWVAYADCHSQGKDAVVQVLEQIDVIHRLVDEYSDQLRFCTTAQCILETSFNSKQGKIASLIGVEGGHLIQSSPGVLRQLYNLGARYLTLTHSCNTPWADASPVDDPTKTVAPLNGGLSAFGLELIDEMNRLGMMVDLSHVSEATMISALERSRAPVIFSHSGAKAICNVHRNVGDKILNLLKNNGGVIMINFYSEYVKCDASPGAATILDVVRHIEHIRDVIGVDYIGLGGDYDGVDSMPTGLEDVSKYPDLFGTLIKRGWLLTDLKKISFTNILRVMDSVEKVKQELAKNTDTLSLPMQSIIPEDELEAKLFTNVEGTTNCSSTKSLSRLLDIKKQELFMNRNTTAERSSFYKYKDVEAEEKASSVIDMRIPEESVTFQPSQQVANLKN